MGRYLVCRLDAIKPDGRMRTSEFFPMEVVTDPDGAVLTYEDIVVMAFNRIHRNKMGGGKKYIGMHDYIVVPLNDAQIISFREPQKEYVVTQTPYASMKPISEAHERFNDEYCGGR